MGRIAAYLGPRTAASALIESGTSSMARQSTECPDGFALAWYPDDVTPEPVIMRSERPASRAEPLLSVPRRYQSECIMAGLRQSPRSSSGMDGLQPFQADRHLFSFDGELERFDEVFLRPLRDRLSDESYRAMQTNEPGELLFRTWMDAMRSTGSTDAEAMAAALEQTVSTVGDIAAAAGVTASFAIVATDGHCLLALRASTQGPPPPLYTIVAGPDAAVPETARVIASEPLFPGAWAALDPFSLVIFTLEALDEPGHVDNVPTETGAAQ